MRIRIRLEKLVPKAVAVALHLVGVAPYCLSNRVSGGRVDREEDAQEEHRDLPVVDAHEEQRRPAHPVRYFPQEDVHLQGEQGGPHGVRKGRPGVPPVLAERRVK